MKIKSPIYAVESVYYGHLETSAQIIKVLYFPGHLDDKMSFGTSTKCHGTNYIHLSLFSSVHINRFTVMVDNAYV